MKKELSSFDVFFLVKELQSLKNSKVEKIYQDKNIFYFVFHVTSVGKKILKIDLEGLMYLIENKPTIQNPPDFCMYLRRKLNNSRLRKIDMLGFERIVKFEFEKEDKFEVVVELFGGGNLLLLKDNIILSAFNYTKFKDRLITPKSKYVYPKRNFNLLDINEKDFFALLKTTNKESVVKSLAIDLGMGGKYAEELCFRAGIDKDSEYKKNIKLFEELNKLRNSELKAFIYFKQVVKDITPIEFKKYTFDKEEKQSFSDALASYYEEEIKKNIVSKENKAKEKILDIIKHQEETIDKMNNNMILNSKLGEGIYENYQLLNEVMAEVNKAVKKLGFKGVRAKLKGHKLIKEINEKEKYIVVEI